jgi:nicotinamide riboside transporter PnuC
MIDALTQGFILVTGVAGQLLVAHKNALGFWTWIASNIVLISVSMKQELPGMAALYVFYTAMCFYSIWRWKNDQPVNAQAPGKAE